MKDKDFEAVKSKEEFLELYDKHDALEKSGCELLLRNEFEIQHAGEDRRYESVWEAGDDEPDFLMVTPIGDELHIDWKSKTKKHYFGWINKRAYDAYTEIQSHPVYVGFGRVKEGEVYEVVFADIHEATTEDKGEQWDKNEVYELSGKAYLSRKGFLMKFVDGLTVRYRSLEEVLTDPLAVRIPPQQTLERYSKNKNREKP